MVNRWIEEQNLLDVLDHEGVGCIVFSPLAQGLLTGRYLDGVPEDSRLRTGKAFQPDWLNEDTLRRIRALNDIARRRGQTLAQLALTWALRDDRITSALIGASSVEQLEDSLTALRGPALTDDEQTEIDKHAVDLGINIWQRSSES